MRILLDECLPKRLARELTGHDARTVPDMGWAGKRNGELLTIAQGQFDVFVTVDRNLSFQNDVHRFILAVVILHARSNKLGDLRPLLRKGRRRFRRKFCSICADSRCGGLRECCRGDAGEIHSSRSARRRNSSGTERPSRDADA